MSVTLKWKNKTFEVPIVDETGSPAFHATTLATLTEKCHAITGVPIDRIKLLMAGGQPQNSPSSSRRQESPQTGDDFWRSVGDSFKSVGKKLETAMDDFASWLDGGSFNERGSFVMMKDPRATLTHYGIRNGSKIMMIGDFQPAPFSGSQESPNYSRSPSTGGSSASSSSRPGPYTRTQGDERAAFNQTAGSMKESGRTPSRPSPPPAPQLAPEVRAIHQIDTILAEMQTTVQPLMHGYLQEAEAYISSKAAGAGFSSEDTQRMEKRLKEEHARVGELLLQGLMKVDGVVVPDGHDEVRSRRKEVVRTLNRWLEQVDAMKDKVQEKTKL